MVLDHSHFLLNISMITPKICGFALGHLNHQGIDNKISACFRCSTRLGSYDQHLMSEIVNGVAAREHRKKLMSGEWPEGCLSCKDFEERGVTSTRFSSHRRYNIDSLLKDYDPETGSIKHVRSIELRFGNECNLTCRHCGPAFSSRWEAIERLDPNIIKNGLYRENEPHTYVTAPGYHKDVLENLVPHLNEIMFSGGETLYQKEHYEFIDAIPPEHAAHICLLYVTNGTVTKLKNYDAIKLWKKFKKIDVIVSTDGVGDQYNYFRQGADWNVVEKNLRIFRDEGYYTSAEITCSVYQMFYLTDTIDYLYDNNLADTITSATVQYPSMINQRIMPDLVKEEVRQQCEKWIDSITDQQKKDSVSYIAQRQVDYMMTDNSDIYNDRSADQLPTWVDFSNSVRLLDRLFKTNVEVSFPRLARHLAR